MESRDHIPGSAYVTVLLLLALSLVQCAEPVAVTTIPAVATSAVTDITAFTATAGGTITRDGNETILASGVVYSSKTSFPTLEDSFIMAHTGRNTFYCLLRNLTPHTTYHVRAYATNALGTGYGKPVTFSTTVPLIHQVVIHGPTHIDSVLQVSYVWDEGDVPGTIVALNWYRADDTMGSHETPIENATGDRYRITAHDEFKYISAGVTLLTSDGRPFHYEQKSAYAGPVPEMPEQVEFMYNNRLVRYEVITSAVTGQRWLDRNLGAQRRATAMDDHLAYGDLFQWGRTADGHQLIDWKSAHAGVPIYSNTLERSMTDKPRHPSFIIPIPRTDWRDPSNSNLWQAPGYINNPCPPGWHVPTQAEWAAENIGNAADAFTRLYLTVAGQRRLTDGTLTIAGATRLLGSYWSSTPFADSLANTYTFYSQTVANPTLNLAGRRGNGQSCRCVEN